MVNCCLTYSEGLLLLIGVHRLKETWSLFSLYPIIEYILREILLRLQES